jgi:hypothetical protein
VSRNFVAIVDHTVLDFFYELQSDCITLRCIFNWLVTVCFE